MLLSGVNGELKDAADNDEIMQVLAGKEAKEGFIHEAMVNPQFGIISGGGPMLTDSNGNPWTGAYVDAMSDLTVDLRSNIAAESRAKLTYEYLIKFTDDPYVKETLRFLMTREVAHYQQFEAALSTIQPNFPPAVLQSDPRYSNLYFNMSSGEDARGPWNEGKSSQMGEQWQYIEDPLQHVSSTNGLLDVKPEGTKRTEKAVQKTNEDLSKVRSEEVKSATPTKDIQWSNYSEEKSFDKTKKSK